MTNLLLCALAVVCIAAAILGGYYRLTSGAMLGTEALQHQQPGTPEEESGATGPEWAEKWRADAWRDENGVVSVGGLANAVAQRDAYLEAFYRPGGLSVHGSPLSPCPTRMCTGSH